MEKLKTAISLPQPVMQGIDAQASEWMTNRSAAITRIYQEWQQNTVQLHRTTAKTQKPQNTAIAR